MSKDVNKWISVVYAPFNVREATRMIRGGMPAEAVCSFLEQMVATWPQRSDVALAAYRDTGTIEAAKAVEYAGREIAARVLAEIDGAGDEVREAAEQGDAHDEGAAS